MTTRAPHADEITREHVAQAIIQLMRGQGGNGQVDQALAGTLAGQVLVDVKKLFVGKSPTQLGSDPAFRSLVTTHLSTATPIDQAAERRAIAERANVTSADFAAATRGQDRHAANGRFSAIITGDIVERGREALPDGQAANGNLTFEQARNMAAARAMASELGMPWAANNPELLKLGPAAIKTLHEAGVQRERFERMTGDKVGFRASTAVAIAAFAKRHNLTPEETNQLYDKISNGAEIVSGGNRAIQRELDQATNAYVTGADTPEARDKLRQAWDKHADTPEKKAAAAQATQAVIDAANQTRAKEAKAEVKEQAAVAKKTEGLGDLEGPPPADTKKDATVPPAAPAPATSGSLPAKAAPPAKPPAPK